MRYTLFDLDDNNLGTVDAPNGDAAVASPAALAVRESARGSRVIARLGIFSNDPTVAAAGDALIDEAHTRLAEAFARLGLSDVAVGHAIAGHDETPLERARRERLTEAAGAIQDVARPGSHFMGKPLADDVRVVTVTKGDKRSGGWDTDSPHRAADLRARAAARRASDAEAAAKLVGAGYDPDDVARALGMPIKSKAKAPTAPPPAPAAPAAPDPVSTTESVRTWGDSEAVTLRETQRLEEVFARLGLNEAERRHAARGRE